MRRGLLFGLLLAAPLSSAHLTGGGGLVSGLTHPFFGIDHLLAMVVVGVLALRSKNLFTLPGVFVGMLLLGGVIGFSTGALYGIEIAVALSVGILGMLLFGMRVPQRVLVGLVGLIGLLHGHAHGTEAAGLFTLYALGFVAGSAALHALGIFGMRALDKYPIAQKYSHIALGCIAIGVTAMLLL